MYSHGVIYSDEDLLQLSGLQHFEFCRRQWALIHIEKQWQDNLRTADGNIFHERAHDTALRELRGNTLTIRGLSVVSYSLGVSGQCDVVEFHKDPSGVSIHGEDGLWKPYPVEYKRGAPKENKADILQLCAQAMCLEEMLCCSIPEGALFYGETRHRQVVAFDEELRLSVRDKLTEMHELYRRGYTPKVKATKSCNACSLKELCLPVLLKSDRSAQYLKDALEDKL